MLWLNSSSLQKNLHKSSRLKTLIISSCLSQLTKVDEMENFTAFSLFAIVASITPGPTNFIILSLSSRYKISKTLPVILGSCIGASFLVLMVGVGLGSTILTYPVIQQIMTWGGLLWLIFTSLEII